MGYRRNVFLRRLIKWALPVTGVALGVLVLYCWHLSALIDKRFSGRRWNVPSTLYSDTTICYPGQRVNPGLFHDKLARLGYRSVRQEPRRKGDLHAAGPDLDIYLNDLNTPWKHRAGFRVKIRFQGDRISSITNPENSDEIPILELEPEALGSFFGDEREQRQLISFDEVPEHLIHAVLAAEDVRFYQHRGVDLRAVLRALYTNIRRGGIRQGGSTITQQLAKNYFLTPDRTLSRKFKELLISLTLEIMYQKNEILEIYLNEIYLGQEGSVSVNGFGEAARFYFGKPVSELSLDESAVLAGLIRSPNYYSPYADPARAQNRRDTVLKTMREKGWISEEQLRSALQMPVSSIGYRPYSKKAPYFIDFLSQQFKDLYPPEVLTREGLAVYSTLDTQVQAAAEQALAKGLARLEAGNPSLKRSDPSRQLQGAIVVLQPKTGYVLAMVGGRDYGTSQFNRITQARRQPGSAFKPFVYLSGLDRFTPASRLSNESKSYEVDGTVWKPQNYADIPDKQVSLRTALTKSINIATVDLAVRLGMDHVIRSAKAFGFSTPLEPFLSISLGAAEVIPIELARAYCPFAAEGVLPYPLLMKSVADEKGNVIEQRHMEIEQVISPAKAFIMSSMLRSVVEEGTARSLKDWGIGFPVAGKTGTTSEFRDAWFVGYTPDILALVWVGFDNEESIHATGSSAALPIWADLIKAVPQYVSEEWFRVPPGVVKRRICLESGQLAVPGICPHQMEEFFLTQNAPQEECPIHRPKGLFQRFIGRMKDLF